MSPPAAPREVLTVAEMAAADRAAVAAGIPEQALMEAAGAAVAQAAGARLPPGGRVLVLCGPGNNGGDGFVAARLLRAAGHAVRLAASQPVAAYRGAAGQAAQAWSGGTEALADLHGQAPADLVIDALFGAGLSRPLEGSAAAVARALNARGAAVLAVDVPSGVGGDSGEAPGGLALRALATVTFCRKKPAHLLLPGRELCGEILLADIGIPDSVVKALAPRTFEAGAWLAEGLPRRGPANHKYDFGYLLIRGGATMTGAARLAARAALRGGAGLVAVAAPPAALPVYATVAGSLILLPAEMPAAWVELLRDPRRNALLVGPGNGVTPETRATAEAALASGRSLVLDADALTVFAGEAPALAAQVRGPLVVTPHEGEFRRLFPELAGDKLARVRAAAKLLGAVVLLKGFDSVIAAPDGRAAINASAPAALAVAGSGDVLAGLIGALLAQGLPAFEAAALAAWLHGRCAEGAGRGLIADDLPEQLPALFAALEAAPPLPSGQPIAREFPSPHRHLESREQDS